MLAAITAATSSGRFCRTAGSSAAVGPSPSTVIDEPVISLSLINTSLPTSSGSNVAIHEDVWLRTEVLRKLFEGGTVI